MTAQFFSELRKLTTTRSAYALLAALVAIIGLGTVAVITDGSEVNLAAPLQQQAFLNVVLSITPLFALLLGIRSFTDEFRFGSIVPTLLANPNRARVLGAKVAAAAAGGVALGITALVTAMAIGVPLLLGDGWQLAWSPVAYGEVAGRLLAATVLWSAIGVGLGLAVRHQVAAVAGALVWMIAGEGIVAGLLPDVARYFPGSAGYALVGVNAGTLLATGTAALVLTAYAVVAIVAGGTLMRRRDIT
jgi:ABC-type transport system involved in multi-copper enzyme maturation permease subunit